MNQEGEIIKIVVFGVSYDEAPGYASAVLYDPLPSAESGRMQTRRPKLAAEEHKGKGHTVFTLWFEERPMDPNRSRPSPG